MALDETLIRDDIEAYLRRHEQKELVRFVTVGSVDDGKSTLIGRLLHDTDGIYEDQLAAVRKASAKKDEEIDFSLFTDGLKAEREQGITIDVAYRYFSTATRKYIIADTPGHVQYTRNMATGASTADVGVILLDARLGVLPQSRRHAYIASLLGIPELLVAVNKMDLVDYRRDAFEKLVAEFGAFAGKLGFRGVTFLPISAKAGDNVVAKSEKTPWWTGPTLLSFLETVRVDRDRSAEPFRLPVQWVIRPNLDYRAFAGQVASGVVAKGDEIVVLPSGRRSRVRAVDVAGVEVAEGFAPQSIALRLDDEVDVSRGDVLAHPADAPTTTRRFDAMLVWMSERALDPERRLLLKQTTRVVPARIERVVHRVDLESLAEVGAHGLALNDVARVTIGTNRPLFVDRYVENRATGAFIVIDALSNDTVAAGMIVEAESAKGREGKVEDDERRARLGQAGLALVVPTLEAAERVERALFDDGLATLSFDAGTLSLPEAREALARLLRAQLVTIVAMGPHDARALAPEGALVLAEGEDEAALVSRARAALVRA